jgi:hypothetical protein
MRTRTRLLLAGTLTVATVYTATIVMGGPSPAESVQASTPHDATGATAQASLVLSAWDARRAAAWSRADLSGLTRLYTAHSRTGARDVADLRRWRARRLRVVGLGQQVARLRVLAETSRRLSLEVTERTVGGVAVRGHRRTALPTSGWVTHRIRMHRVRGRWLVAEVSLQPAR